MRFSILKLGVLIIISFLSFSFIFAEERPLEFETPYLAEKMDPLIELREAKDIKTFQEKLEELIVSVFPSLSPPVISEVEVKDITTNSAVITWKTNVKSSSIVAFAPEDKYQPNKKNPYLMEIIAPGEMTTEHRVELLNLSPGTKYHFKVKSASIVGVMGESKDMTFNTLASKIKLEVVKITNTEIEVRWVTPAETDSWLEYKDLKTGKIGKIGDETKVKTHILKLENLTPDTSYLLRGYGYDVNNILIESDPITVKTKKDAEPPKISNLRIDNALLPGRVDKVLTVVTWRTNEPANSLVYFEEGLGIGELKNKAGKEDEFVLEHTVILVTKTGTVYRLQVVSADESGNKEESSIKTILTPRSEESILDIIIKNFEETFKFLKRR